MTERNSAPLPRSVEFIENQVFALGPEIAEHAVLVGNSATFAALGPDSKARTPGDIDLAIPADMYSWLREPHRGWTEEVTRNKPLLQNGIIEGVTIQMGMMSCYPPTYCGHMHYIWVMKGLLPTGYT